jgi:hypothetical protein
MGLLTSQSRFPDRIEVILLDRGYRRSRGKICKVVVNHYPSRTAPKILSKRQNKK